MFEEKHQKDLAETKLARSMQYYFQTKKKVVMIEHRKDWVEKLLVRSKQDCFQTTMVVVESVDFQTN